MHKAEPQMQNLEMFNTKPHSRQYTNWLEWCLHVDYRIVFWHSFCCQDVKHISRGSKQLEAMKIPASLPRQLRLFPPPNLFIHMPSNNRMMMMMMMMMMMNDDEWWWMMMMMNDDEWWWMMMNDDDDDDGHLSLILKADFWGSSRDWVLLDLWHAKTTSQDLSRVEVKHPMDVLRKGEEVRCFVKQLLRRKWKQTDFTFYEIHEAFVVGFWFCQHWHRDDHHFRV